MGSEQARARCRRLAGGRPRRGPPARARRRTQRLRRSQARPRSPTAPPRAAASCCGTGRAPPPRLHPCTRRLAGWTPGIISTLADLGGDLAGQARCACSRCRRADLCKRQVCRPRLQARLREVPCKQACATLQGVVHNKHGFNSSMLVSFVCTIDFGKCPLYCSTYLLSQQSVTAYPASSSTGEAFAEAASVKHI